MEFGSMEWAAATGGRVAGFERIARVWEAIRYRMKRRVRSGALGAVSPGEVDRMLSEIELPKTLLVERAFGFVSALGPEALAGHAVRTWAWGALLALRDGLVYDREAFALGALLHDVALAEPRSAGTCFAAEGASRAVELLSGWGAPAPLCRNVGEAVCLHLRVQVPLTLGVEAHLVHAGSGMDVVGAGFHRVNPAVREKVLARYPRHGLKRYLVSALGRERDEHPASRIALWASLGFLRRVEAAPFDE